MKKISLKIALAGFFVLATLSGCGRGLEEESTTESELKTVGFSQLGAESDWRTANTDSMKNTFTEANGYSLIFDDGQQKQDKQITAVRKFIQQEVDYIAIAPVKETGWETVLQEAKDVGIPVIIVDRQVDIEDDDLYTAWVGSDFKLESEMACEWLYSFSKSKNINPEDINIVNIQGTIGATAQIGRTNGLAEAAKKYGWNLLEATSGDYTQTKSKEVMEDMLSKYNNINVVYCENDNEAIGAIEALEAKNMKVGTNIEKGEVLVISFDATHAGLKYVLEGKIALDIECNPLHGPRVKEIIDIMEHGGHVEKQTYVKEEMFSIYEEVREVEVNGTKYSVKPVTQELIDSREY